MRTARLLSLGLIIAASACSATDVNTAKLDTATNGYCQGLNKLVAAYADDFKSLKGQRNATRYMDIWQTEFQLVGNSCEIWGWGSGKENYVCSKTLPNQEVATERYEAAKGIIQACLPNWSLQESPRKLGEGQKALYQKNGELPGVAVHMVATKGLFRSEWTAYVFVGDPNDQL